jgi:hypothetical protein
VQDAIHRTLTLYPELKEVYDKDTFREQSGKVFNFMMEQAEGRGWAYA